jgi:hypothetical protein
MYINYTYCSPLCSTPNSHLTPYSRSAIITKPETSFFGKLMINLSQNKTRMAAKVPFSNGMSLVDRSFAMVIVHIRQNRLTKNISCA